MLFFILIVWVFFCVLVEIAAWRHFNRNIGWGLIAAVISPLLAILLLLALGPAKPPAPEVGAAPSGGRRNVQFPGTYQPRHWHTASDWRPLASTPRQAWDDNAEPVQKRSTPVWQPVPRTPPGPPKPRQWTDAEPEPARAVVQRPTAPPPHDDWLGNLVPVRRGVQKS
jgi:hypothetical protein